MRDSGTFQESPCPSNPEILDVSTCLSSRILHRGVGLGLGLGLRLLSCGHSNLMVS